jgi:hypothetical protein
MTAPHLTSAWLNDEKNKRAQQAGKRGAATVVPAIYTGGMSN